MALYKSIIIIIIIIIIIQIVTDIEVNSEVYFYFPNRPVIYCPG